MSRPGETATGGAPGQAGAARRLVRALGRYKLHYFLGTLCLLATLSVELVIPLVFGRGFIDQVLLSGAHLEQLNRLLLLALGLMVAKGLFNYGRVYLLSYGAQRAVTDLRYQMFDHLHGLPLAFFERRRTGELVAGITADLVQVQSSLHEALPSLFHDILVLAGVLGFMLFINWRMALVVCLVFPLVGIAVTRFGGRIKAASRQVQERLAELSAQLAETLSGIRVVKAFTLEEQLRRRFARSNEQGFAASMKSVQMMATVSPMVDLLVTAGVGGLLWIGGREVLTEQLTLGELVSFLTYATMATGPINSITRSYGLVQQATGAAERVYEFLDTRLPGPDVSGGGRRLSTVRGSVTFRDVWFTYPRSEVPALTGIDLEVAPGEVVALVGPSGAGKSTLMNLLPRFYDPTRGALYLDGHDLRGLDLAFLRRVIGLVPQDTVLFGVSVWENIACGRPDATREEVLAAARAAQADEFIRRLPRGYDTVLGERGLNLSGGQRQRIAIARALLRDPRILILDEATSALDQESETLVQEALRRLMEGRTTFIVAHRLSTVRTADRIVVLDRGRIVESGPHKELLARGGLYRRLYELYAAGATGVTGAAGAGGVAGAAGASGGAGPGEPAAASRWMLEGA